MLTLALRPRNLGSAKWKTGQTVAEYNSDGDLDRSALFGTIIGQWALRSGAGVLGLFRAYSAEARPTWMRLIARVVFVVPAALAGFLATNGVAKLAVPSDVWQATLSVAGALSVGANAQRRIGSFRPAAYLGRAVMSSPGSRKTGLYIVHRCSSLGADDAIGPTLPFHLSGPHPHVLFNGLIWPKDGYASIASAAMAPFNFLPLDDHPVGARPTGTSVRPFLAQQQSCSVAILRFASASAGAASIACGLSIAIEAAVGADSEDRKRSGTNGYYRHLQDVRHERIHWPDYHPQRPGEERPHRA